MLAACAANRLQLKSFHCPLAPLNRSFTPAYVIACVLEHMKVHEFEDALEGSKWTKLFLRARCAKDRTIIGCIVEAVGAQGALEQITCRTQNYSTNIIKRNLSRILARECKVGKDQKSK